MKRFHVHVSVEDIEDSIRFYSAMFNTAPTVQKPDYAKWMLEDPRINFAISQRGASAGVNHLGIQVDSDNELAALQAQLEAANLSVVSEPQTTCCYAESDKHWTTDPSGIAWESYRTLGSAPTYNRAGAQATCCAPPSPKLQTLPTDATNCCALGSGCC
ncbi:ArsI/CadI family heavy metal resistance metalloenzyme [Chitiniphilus eburneus]|uniref:Glyoxalase/bleomycin resistance/dioxygenase family protein n=1 Tax=Chitiniphilus eburneus TaxID=2571148 RepID=A0A4U0PM58_9NEIS|nr:ArsI/CadI family heavy metal resistance metalloenzyme [Chitiniphilus eburneus]TJZ68372.1 glyoxalase/bleomycin resistance/dioxygenase family protein [Chitiniphilus eburneus]